MTWTQRLVQSTLRMISRLAVFRVVLLSLFVVSLCFSKGYYHDSHHHYLCMDVMTMTPRLHSPASPPLPWEPGGKPGGKPGRP